MTDEHLVWSDELGDMRKKNKKQKKQDSGCPVEENKLQLKLRRLTSGKGRVIIEISDLPPNKKWCQALAKELKKKIAVGGSYKDNKIEIHGEKIKEVMECLDQKSLLWKKTGG